MAAVLCDIFSIVIEVVDGVIVRIFECDFSMAVGQGDGMCGDELWDFCCAVVGVFVGGPLVGLMMVCCCVLGEYDAAVGKEFCLRKDDFVLVI